MRDRHGRRDESNPVIPLGPFDLVEPLAAGAMGEVWQAIHRAQDVGVAVKVITARHARAELAARAIVHEVRSMARLVHPRIVMILDQGWVDAEAAARSQGRLVEGSPFFAMELARGTLRGWWPRGVRSWAALLDVLVQVMDALAYAHAREVIHRDLKPANVLASGDERRPLWKLSDFGIAHCVAEEQEDPNLAYLGTPAYMAPEQIEGQVRDLGPWTDLYALGCLAWRMTTGEHPFTGSYERLVMSKLLGTPPEFRSRVPVPDRFEAWLRKLLERDPAHRFQRAADAAWALHRLRSPTARARQGVHATATNLAGDEPTVSFTLSTELTTPDRAGLTEVDARGLVGAKRIRAAAREHAFEADATPGSGSDRPPLPRFWTRTTAGRTPPSLLGAGLRLYGLRRIPIVDRERHRDSLWSALGEVHETGCPRLVVLEGATGYGKSRLAEWICERAHEVGGATVVSAVHSEQGSAVDGLAPMVERFLRCQGLPRAEVAKRVQAFSSRTGAADPAEVAELTELVRPLGVDEATGGAARVRLAGAGDRRRALTRFLRRVSRERPALIWLDDVQWGPESLSFARTLMASGEPAVLIVLTARTEALEDRPEQARSLSELAAMSGSRPLEVGPLPASDRTALVQELLGLRSELAADVERRTEGNPLFAVQLVGDWVQRGILTVSDEGLALRRGAEATIPDAVHDLWVDRTATLLRDRPADDRSALEIAAVLGAQVSIPEWRLGCAKAGVEPSTGLLGALIDRNLAHGDGDRGFAFVHGMLPESLTRIAREGGRVAAHRRACAEALLELGSEELECHPARAEPVLSRALALADPAELGVHGRALYTLGHVHQRLGNTSRSQRLLETSLEVLQRAGDLRTQGRALDIIGNLHHDQGRVDLARKLYLDAIALARDSGDREGEGALIGHLAIVDFDNGRYAIAQERYEAALAIHREVGNRRQEGVTLGNLAHMCQIRGEVERARELYEETRAVHRQVGHGRGEAVVIGNLAMLAREEGRLQDALELCAEAKAMHRERGSRRHEAFISAIEAETYRRAPRLREARKTAEEALDLARTLGLKTLVSFLLGLLAELSALEGDPGAASRTLEEAYEVGADYPFEVGRLHCRRAAIAVVHGEHDEARSALADAEHLVRELGMGPRSQLGVAIEEVRKALGTRSQP